MTHPVQEPSTDRQISGLDYRTRQLARRPSLAQGAFPWARASKTFGSTVQSIPNNSNTDIVWDEWYNIGAGDSGEGVFDNPDYPTPAQDLGTIPRGTYLAKVWLAWNVTNVGAFKAGVSGYDAYIDWIIHGDTTLFGGQLEFAGATVLHLDPGEGISVTLYHAAGAARGLDAAFLHMVYLGTYTGLDSFEMDPDHG